MNFLNRIIKSGWRFLSEAGTVITYLSLFGVAILGSVASLWSWIEDLPDPVVFMAAPITIASATHF